MLMRRNVAAGIGSNEQGEYCRAALHCSDLDRKEPRYKCPTLLKIPPHPKCVATLPCEMSASHGFGWRVKNGEDWHRLPRAGSQG